MWIYADGQFDCIAIFDALSTGTVGWGLLHGRTPTVWDVLLLVQVSYDGTQTIGILCSRQLVCPDLRLQISQISLSPL